MIYELDEFKGAWWALSKLDPERLSALRRVATIESTGSFTRIDGSSSRITVADAVAVTGASRNTLKDQCKLLVEKGHLVSHGADVARGTALRENQRRMTGER